MATLAEKLPEVFGREQAPRKTIDYYKKTDPSKAEEQIQKSKDFAIKMILSGAKNTDPFAEDSGSNQANQMLETANLIAQLDSSLAQVSKMDEMVNAIKNPGYDAFELQGKEISYNNGKKFFDGKSPVTFEYNLKSLGSNKDLAISTTIKIKDKEGNIIQEARGASALGDHKFTWDGFDKKGKKVPEGHYSIEVSSTGSGVMNGKAIPFAVQATTLTSAVVTSIDIQDGVVKRLTLDNGTTIEKNQVVKINKEQNSNQISQLSNDLIAKKVELDFSKTKISDGNIKVYFNNHVQNPGPATVDIYDEHNKLVKTLESNDIKPGVGKLSFTKTGIENGNYTVKINIKNLDSNKLEPLNPIFNTKVVGVNYRDQTIVTLGDYEFDIHNVNKVLAEYTSDIDRRAAEYQGSNIEFNDSVFKFQPGTFSPEIIAKAPLEDGAVIAHELLRIYTKDNELVATLTANYNPFDQLDDASKATATADILAGNQYSDLPPEQQVAINRHIEENITNGTYRFKEAYANVAASGGRKIKFPTWDGAFGNMAPQNLHGGHARADQEFVTEHSTVYVKTNGTMFNSESRVDVSIGSVESIDKENGELFLNLQGGQRIPESRVIGIVRRG